MFSPFGSKPDIPAPIDTNVFTDQKHFFVMQLILYNSNNCRTQQYLNE